MTALNPFGKYSDILTTIVAAFVIIGDVVIHAWGLHPGADSTFIDAAAWISLGSMFGKVSAANGYAAMARSAHARLDAIGAPPSNDGAGPAVDSRASVG